jgi:catechol 2,3-dioxygenase-like lactoylglutathione lyase family enzyme
MDLSPAMPLKSGTIRAILCGKCEKGNSCLRLYGIRKFMMNKLIAAKLVRGLIVVVSLSLFAAVGVGLPAAATLPGETTAPVLDPAIYHHVSQVTWVVSDVDRVVGRWQQLGIKNIHPNGVVQFPGLTYRGKPDPASAKQVTANVGQMQINWLQPLRGGKFWRDELRKHGDGIRVLSYDVRSPQEFDEQIKYFASNGVGVVVQDSWQGPTGRGRMAYLDTAAQGGGTMLGLIDDPDDRSRIGATVGGANEYPLGEFKHFAWVVSDVRKVDAYYTSLGFKPLSSIDHNISLDRIYRGQPGNYEMWLGWNRTGDAPFEWVQQITGPDVYVEYGKKHGEGFHHLGVIVTDMDEAIKLITARGAAPSQAAAWNTKNGKGRAVYMDTEPYGGVTLELIYDPR